jgi:Uma2 family endonuclease
MSEGYVADSRYTVEAYFDLVKRGLLDEDDRVELLEGIIVAEPPMDPPHAVGIQKLADAVRSIVRDRAAVRTQSPFLAFPYSVPEPDVAVVPGRDEDYWERHPTSALLVVEVSNTSLKQDRLSKSRIYAGAAIPEYWIVNLRGDCIEVFRSPDRERRIYVERFTAQRGETLAPIAFPDGSVAVEALLPPPRPRFDD